MSMFLLLPVGLAALAALLLPLLLHLARRSEPRVVSFAALRWLRAAPQPRRRRRFEELLLLLLRLLLLAALALLLAQPVLFGHADRSPYVAVAPGVDIAAARTRMDEGEARWHWLAPGFPEVEPERDAPDDGSASFASLLRELDATLPMGTPLTVLAPSTIERADAQRPVLSREVEWRVMAEAANADADAGRQVASESRERPARLQVRHAPQRAASVRYLCAAGAAWASADPGLLGSVQSEAADPGKLGSTGNGDAGASASNPVTIAPATQPLEPDTHHLAWLVRGPLPDAVRDWVTKGGTILLDADAQWPGFPDDAPVVWRDADGPLARAIRTGKGRVIRLERALLPTAMPVLLEPDFPRQLLDLFADAPPAPARVEARDYAPRTGATPYPERPRPLSPWLALLVALLFLLERLVAAGPRRSETA